MPEEEKQPWRVGALRRLGDGELWRRVAAVVGLVVLSLAVATAYVVEPQSPRDFVDRLVLVVEAQAFGPNLRHGERLYARAGRALEIGADSLADDLLRRSQRAYGRASASAPGPREELAANDGLADTYLELGWRYLARGRGGRFGLGRRPESLDSAERVGTCVVGIAPTRRRAQINEYIEELEAVLERPIAGRCPE
ncbi:MAG: hypothetical protein JSW46_15995 [Gemmatimonadota bacterium]|nr:MAG: hypothetical protein JSW46_15995 [Gemmatimonadota bacterium]